MDGAWERETCWTNRHDVAVGKAFIGEVRLNHSVSSVSKQGGGGGPVTQQLGPYLGAFEMPISSWMGGVIVFLLSGFIYFLLFQPLPGLTLDLILWRLPESGTFIRLRDLIP